MRSSFRAGSTRFILCPYSIEHMNFFTESDLSEIYGKPFSEISPTDTPKEKYIAGVGTLSCRECGEELAVGCNPSGRSSWTYEWACEKAYCENCSILYTRNREAIIDDPKYERSNRRVDEREEYVCSNCKVSHPFSTPTDEWSYESTATVHSYEQISIACPCGSQVTIQNGSLPYDLSCEKCHREYSLVQTEETS